MSEQITENTVGKLMKLVCFAKERRIFWRLLNENSLNYQFDLEGNTKFERELNWTKLMWAGFDQLLSDSKCDSFQFVLIDKLISWEGIVKKHKEK